MTNGSDEQKPDSEDPPDPPPCSQCKGTGLNPARSRFCSSCLGSGKETKRAYGWQ